MNDVQKAVLRWIATGGYVGYCPIAPGTCGSLLALVLFVLVLSRLALPGYVFMVGGLILLGVWAAGATEQLLGRKDAAPIVIDEIVGLLVAYTSVPVSVAPLVVGFLVFRLVDIAKPLPQLEKIAGGWGMMLDDLLAGVLAQACVRLFLWVV